MPINPQLLENDQFGLLICALSPKVQSYAMIFERRLQSQQACETLTPHHSMFHQHHTNDFLRFFLKIIYIYIKIINNFMFGSQEKAP